MEDAVILGLTTAVQSIPSILAAAQAIQASGSGDPTALATLNAAVAAVRTQALADVAAAEADLGTT